MNRGDLVGLLVRASLDSPVSEVAVIQVKGVDLVSGGGFAFLKDEKSIRVVGAGQDQLAALGILKPPKKCDFHTQVFEAAVDGETKVYVAQHGTVYEVKNLSAVWESKLGSKKPKAKG